MGKARAETWVFFAVPAAELLLGLALSGLPCGMDLALWLRVDAALSLAGASVVGLTARALSPAYERLHADPVGSVQRWQNTQHVPDFESRLEIVFPGVRVDTYRCV